MLNPNILESEALEAGYDFIIDHQVDGWYVTQFIDGPAVIDTPFFIGADTPAGQRWIKEWLADDSEVEYA